MKLSVEGDFVRLEVVDTGIGMSEEYVAMVFDEFYRETQAKEDY